MNKDIETKVKDIVEGNNLTQSQLDRIVDPKAMLIGYLNSYVSKVQQEDDLLMSLRERFQARLDDDNLSDAMALRIFEVLSRKQSEDNAPLLNLFAKALETPKGKPSEEQSPTGDQSHNEGSFTKEEVQSAKKFLSKIEAIEKEELSEKELNNKK